MAQSVPANLMIAAGLTRIGCPYEWDAKGPDAFDCSGLVTWAAVQAGLPFVPTVDNTFALVVMGRPVSTTDQTKWRRGDFLFSNANNHVQMFLGTYLIDNPTAAVLPVGQTGLNWILEAPQTGEDVHIIPQWVTEYTAVRRMVPVTT